MDVYEFAEACGWFFLDRYEALDIVATHLLYTIQYIKSIFLTKILKFTLGRHIIYDPGGGDPGSR
jgi:hypothetical protein